MSLSDYGYTAAPFKSVFVLSVLLALVALALAAVFYLLKALAIYDMSKAVGIKERWHGFVPFFRDLASGNIASGKASSGLGKILTVFSLVKAILKAALFCLQGSVLIDLIFAADSAMVNGAGEFTVDAAQIISKTFVLSLIVVIVQAVYCIIKLVCLYKIFRKFSTVNAVVMALLSIIIPILEPILLFCVRNGNVKAVNNADNHFDFIEE